MGFEIFIANRIPNEVFSFRMLSTVYFDTKSPGRAVEVENIGADAMLAPKLFAAEATFSQLFPEF